MKVESIEIAEAYRIVQLPGQKMIVCHECGKASYNRVDIEVRYCGFCHKFLLEAEGDRERVLKWYSKMEGVDYDSATITGTRIKIDPAIGGDDGGDRV